MAENKEFYLVIKGEKVIVSEEVYRAYKSSDRAERKRKQRMWRCRIKREKGINNQWKRCQGNCEECQFKQQKMSDVSLDALKEEGFDGVDESLDVEANFIAREERKEMYQKLKQAISSLKPVQREIIKMIYVEGKSQKEVAKELGIAESTLSGRVKLIISRPFRLSSKKVSSMRKTWIWYVRFISTDLIISISILPSLRRSRGFRARTIQRSIVQRGR